MCNLDFPPWFSIEADIVGAIDDTYIPLAIPPDNSWTLTKIAGCLLYSNVLEMERETSEMLSSIISILLIPSNHFFTSLSRSAVGGQAKAFNQIAMISMDSFLVGDAGLATSKSYCLTPWLGGQAFGHLKNPFWILLHAQNALPIRPRNTTCTLYLQDWEACTSAEILLAELPCEASNSTTNPDISEGSVVSCTLKEIFSKTFCIYLKSNTLLLPIQSFIDCPVGFSHHHTSEAWHI
ncbi:hypothetical protein VP01_2479g4 [Puccinia sorghi]|uniref:Uncharacterized protein n=1 Tax=Puccinia sorghi TaxID=27349 RepID=A0A0L6V7S6_9BASI|nr:hypothetical protein VP01_2479g4 [Puccinia sorghi]